MNVRVKTLFFATNILTLYTRRAPAFECVNVRWIGATGDSHPSLVKLSAWQQNRTSTVSYWNFSLLFHVLHWPTTKGSPISCKTTYRKCTINVFRYCKGPVKKGPTPDLNPPSPPPNKVLATGLILEVQSQGLSHYSSLGFLPKCAKFSHKIRNRL